MASLLVIPISLEMLRDLPLCRKTGVVHRLCSLKADFPTQWPSKYFYTSMGFHTQNLLQILLVKRDLQWSSDATCLLQPLFTLNSSLLTRISTDFCKGIWPYTTKSVPKLILKPKSWLAPPFQNSVVLPIDNVKNDEATRFDSRWPRVYHYSSQWLWTGLLVSCLLVSSVISCISLYHGSIPDLKMKITTQYRGIISCFLTGYQKWSANHSDRKHIEGQKSKIR